MIKPDQIEALSEFKMGAGQALNPLKLYGQDVYFPAIMKELVRLALQLHTRLNKQEASHD